MPCEQGLGSNDGSNSRQSAAAHCFREGSESAALSVGETEPPITDLFTKNAILFVEVVDGELLMPVEPARKACNEQ